jgi:signal transduction histidine kinase
MVHPKYREMVKRYGLERQRGIEVPARYEVQYITRGGEVRWGEFAAGQIEYRGRPAGIVIAFDVTDRKKAEVALIDAKAQADLYLDLMGHDIRNYNQIALGFLELAIDMLAKNKEEQELLSKPMDAVNNSSRLIDNIMKLKRVTGGKAKGNRPMDLCNVLDRIKASYSNIPGRQVTINYHPIPKCGIMANDLIYDIFTNIVGNAIKHTKPEKPLAIDVRVKEQTMEGKEYLEVSIEDNGLGIPDELKEELFTRLERGKTKASGRGLGLYLVKTLADNFDGRVRVEDRVTGDYHQGVRFIIVLPTKTKGPHKNNSIII